MFSKGYFFLYHRQAPKFLEKLAICNKFNFPKSFYVPCIRHSFLIVASGATWNLKNIIFATLFVRSDESDTELLETVTYRLTTVTNALLPLLNWK